MPVVSRASASRSLGRRTVAALAAMLLALTLLATVPAPSAAEESGTDPWRRAVGGDVTGDVAEQHRQRVAAAGHDATSGAWAAAGVIPGELIVTTRIAGDVQQRAVGWQSQAPGFLSARSIADRVALVTVDADRTPAVVAALQADPAVIAVEPNVRREFLATPDDTSFGLQWGHSQTNAPTAWDTYNGQGGTAPLIAILDSGIDATHPDLSGVVVSSLRSANGSVFPGAPANDPCGIGHGTAVAGSAAAQGNNALGVSGALWQARVIDIALTSPENGCPGGPADSDTINAMTHVANLAEAPLAMNLSLGASLAACTAGYQAAVDQARAAGIVVVAAAGNDGSSQTSIPASCDGVISVGATNSAGGRASYSQTNPQVDIAAPGGDAPTDGICPFDFAALVSNMFITTSLTDITQPFGPVCGDYSDPNGHRLQGISGTSFASPYIAGAVGLLRQLAINNGAPLSVDETEAILQSTASDAGQAGRDCEFGFGILDLGAAVAAVQSGARPALQPNASIGGGTCSGNSGPPPTSGSCAVTQARVANGYVRIAADGATNAICQAVAVSSVLPDGAAPYAVLAREDDSADALAGSAVGFGVGPLLFTPSTGTLDPRTEAELVRVLNFDNRTPDVFIMGGTAAVPQAVDARLQELGINPRRIAGNGREATAVQASQMVEELKANVQFETRDYAFVAFGRNWPDAVAAGQMAAYYGIPVLVTNTDSLHPDSAAELQRLQPSRVFVLGGTAVLSDTVVQDIQGLGLEVQRLAGAGRVDTALAVAEVYETELIADAQNGGQPPLAVAVNMDNNFNDILSASLIGGQGNIYMPLAGDGSIVPDAVAARFCNMGEPLIVVGGTDRIDDGTAGRGAEVAAGSGC